MTHYDSEVSGRKKARRHGFHQFCDLKIVMITFFFLHAQTKLMSKCHCTQMLFTEIYDFRAEYKVIWQRRNLIHLENMGALQVRAGNCYNSFMLLQAKQLPLKSV